MSDKLQNAREYILRNIESAEFKGGEKLPSARDLAEQTGISAGAAENTEAKIVFLSCMWFFTPFSHFFSIRHF